MRSPLRTNIKLPFLHTTAIASLVLAPLAPIAPANAAAIVISTPTGATQTLGAGDTITVTSTGSISGVNPAINLSNVVAVSATNSGLISGTSAGISLTANSDFTGGIINNSGGTISGGTASINLQNSDLSGGILNNGTITGTIRIRTSSSVSNAIRNNGTITGGITIIDTSSLSGGIINAGTISDNNSTISINGNSSLSGGINNSGTITSSGFFAISLVDNAALTGGIVNSGTLFANAGTIFLGSSTITGGINNSGTISSNLEAIGLTQTSSISGGITNSGIISGGTGIGINLNSNSSIAGGIVNSGTISSATARGINIFNGSSISDGIINSANGIISGGTGGIRVELNADIIGGITNSGTISGGSRGISVINNSSISGGITNNSGGVIAGNSFGISLSTGSTITGQILNSGTISGATGITVSGNSNISGGITNNTGGIIQGTGGTAIDLRDLTAAAALTLNGGRIIGDVVDDNISAGFSDTTIGGDFTTEGDFTVSDLVVTAGNTLTISGGDTFTVHDMSTSTGTFSFGITEGLAGQLIVANGNLDFTGASLAVSFNNANLRVGDQILLADGTTPLLNTAGGVGLIATALPDQSYLLDSLIADGSQPVITNPGADNTQLYLTLVQAHTIEESALNDNHRRAGRVLDTLVSSSDPVLVQVFDNFNNAPTREAVDALIETTIPTVDGGAMVAGMTLAGKSFDLAGAKLVAARKGGSGLATGNMGEGVRAWGQAFAEQGTQDKRETIDGYDSTTYGVAIGVDTQNINENTVLGLALSTANTQVESDNGNATETEVNSYQLTLYGDYDIDELAYISGLLGYVYSDNDSTRYNVGGTSARANATYASHQYVAEVKAGRSFYTDGGIKITPNALAHYTHYQADDYTETGAGGANLSVQSEALNVLEVGAGVDVGWESLQVGGAVVKPEFSAGYRYDLIGDPVATTARFNGGGASFRTEGFEPAQGSFNLGAALGYVTPYGWEFVMSYDFAFKEDYAGHAAFLKAGYKF
jgi:outer membrane autotransporter protein